ncbi:putative oligomerization/nucleic acid binding protein [Kribbella orskensis]|uniref:Oligomerization/nucleic acid binding protein n=1 Tax=Kribbella orskensis TaxID=2512216 RepID=A0ABY2B5Q1_9ACTN|nr:MULTISPECIES: SHOCT domain-containing protein [Kribbella]TCN27650.1 putative oligomerization/nucleic acid binding protein [Kribbella sp. VKM Ac-2500]TCO07572.1 putative oligomerization/nucleic acid binding protein [Kribbella orskensis]
MMHDALDPSLGWILLGLTVWFAVIGGAVAATVRAIRKPPPHPATRYPSPLDILERRLASGEITHEEFDEARARLREHEIDR